MILSTLESMNVIRVRLIGRLRLETAGHGHTHQGTSTSTGYFPVIFEIRTHFYINANSTTFSLNFKVIEESH